MNTISDIANKSNRKLYMNHLSSLAKLREARLRIEKLEAVLLEISNALGTACLLDCPHCTRGEQK